MLFELISNIHFFPEESFLQTSHFSSYSSLSGRSSGGRFSNIYDQLDVTAEGSDSVGNRNMLVGGRMTAEEDKEQDGT